MNEQQQEPAITPDSSVDPVVLGLAILVCSFICMLAYFLFAVFFADGLSFYQIAPCAIGADEFNAAVETRIASEAMTMAMILSVFTLPFALKIARLSRE